MEKHIDGIVEWLQYQVHNTGTNGLVTGVSGGLDSAVVSHLIKRAFPNDSLGVIMPLKSNEKDVAHAKKVLETGDIQHISVDLTKTHDIMYETIAEQLPERNTGDGKDPLEDANLRARLRMSTLYMIAQHYRYLVVGTDNASEYYTGYFTKYGDGGVDILPLVEYTKHEVRKMAEYLNVPDEVIQKVPSADLWEGQTDENEMGTTYDHIDAYLKGKEIPEKDRKTIETMHRKSKHKRHIPSRYERP